MQYTYDEAVRELSDFLGKHVTADNYWKMEQVLLAVLEGDDQIYKLGYEAIEKVFGSIADNFYGKRIAYPKIGAGLAGGDWEIISSIIDEELEGMDHTVVIL